MKRHDAEVSSKGLPGNRVEAFGLRPEKHGLTRRTVFDRDYWFFRPSLQVLNLITIRGFCLAFPQGGGKTVGDRQADRQWCSLSVVFLILFWRLRTRGNVQKFG